MAEVLRAEGFSFSGIAERQGMMIAESFFLIMKKTAAGSLCCPAAVFLSHRNVFRIYSPEVSSG